MIQKSMPSFTKVKDMIHKYNETKIKYFFDGVDNIEILEYRVWNQIDMFKNTRQVYAFISTLQKNSNKVELSQAMENVFKYLEQDCTVNTESCCYISLKVIK